MNNKASGVLRMPTYIGDRKLIALFVQGEKFSAVTFDDFKLQARYTKCCLHLHNSPTPIYSIMSVTDYNLLKTVSGAQ